MPNYLQLGHEKIVKEEPLEKCPDAEPIMEPIPSESALHVDSTQVQPGSGSVGTEMETIPLESVLHPDDTELQLVPGSGTTEMETGALQSVLHVKSTQVQPSLDTGTTEAEDDEEFWPLSGKPFFSVILARSHVTSPYHLPIPAKMVQQLPSTTVPVVLRYCGKSWNMDYLGASKNKRFDYLGWKTFVIDNNLKVGYGCFFELSECSQAEIKFRVQILKIEGLPFLADDEGKTPGRPIFID